jgi:hypothetical protein
LDADVPNDPVELYSIDIHQYPVNFCISNNFLFTGGEYEPYIIVCDLSLEHPRAIDHLYLGYRDFVDVCAQDSIAFVATRPSENSGITIIDATNPYQLREINHIALNTEIFDVKVARSKVFLATRSDGIIIIDVSNLDELRELGRIDALDYVYEVEVVNNNLFVADGSLRIYDISDIDNIQIVSVFDFPGRAQTIECIDDLVFVGTSQRDTHDPPGGIYMLNISDLDSPELIGFCNTYGWPSDITLDLPYVYVAEYRHLAVYNCEQALKVEVKTQIYPIDFALLVYPNPFNSSTIISFSVPRPGEVYLSLFDTMGRKVQDFLYRSWMPAGKYQRLLELSDLTAGTYLIRLESKDKAVSRTITYLK